SQLGAALAYYAVFAFAPMAVLALAIAGYIYGPEAAQGELYFRLKDAVGPAFAEAIQDSLRHAHQSDAQTWWASAVSMGVIILAAMGVFGQLQQSLNTIWGVQAKAGRGIWGIVKDRLMSFVMVLIVSALLLASLVSSTVVHALSDRTAA